ncbi:MAG: YegS/Rv2252/BmrU family lipid kinase [Eubacteriales bacterium]|nr:YegS/Rv2252/BmrU family lipid kinase [Eubacteriales bacterium]
MKKLILICNPRAGKGISGEKLKEMLSFYTSRDFLPTVYFTKKDDDLMEIISEAKNYDQLVVCGGDGMMNAVCTAVQKSDYRPKIGYLPHGTTNDFAKSIGIPFSFNEMLETSISENVKKLDTGYINDRFFMYVAGFGLFTDVSYKTPQSSKNALGYLAYVLEGVKSISEIRTYHLKVKVGSGENGEVEEIEDDFIMGLVTNSMSVAGMKVLSKEDTKLDDGIFEMLLIKKPSSINDLREAVESMVMTNTNAGLMIYRQGSSFSFEGDELSWCLDGEFGGSYGHTEISVENGGMYIRT